MSRWWVLVLCGCGFQGPPATPVTPDDAAIDTLPPIQCADLTCDPRATCLPGPPASCACQTGWAGDGMTCTDVDECAAGSSGCAAACVNTVGGFTCYTPRTCADVAAKITLPDNTSVTLYYNGDPAKPWTAFCHGGHEYLTLPAGPTANYGQYLAGGKANGSDVKTTYSRIRLDPTTLLVDICDQSFAASQGALDHPNGSNPIHVTSMPFGVAMECRGANSHDSPAHIDLTGTPFVVTDPFEIGGVGQAGTTSTVPSQTVSLTGGGNCGWNAPAPAPFNPFNTFSGGQILNLSYP